MATVTKVLSPQEERIERGQDQALTTEQARTKRARLGRMLHGLRDKPPRVNVERARLLTESFEQTEHLPLVMKWAKALEHILSNITIYIGPDELIAGRLGPPGTRSGLIYPELRAGWLLSAAGLRELPKRKEARFSITEDDIRVIAEEIAPYWKGKTYHEAYIGLLPEDTRRLMYAEDDTFASSPVMYDVTTTNDSMNFVPNYEKALEKGFNGIKKEAEERLASLDVFDSENNYEKMFFLKAVITVCEAMGVYGKRHAEMARRMAETEENEQRKKELLEIAEVCEWVPGNPARTFREALQCQWFVQLACRLETMSFEPSGSQGRIDQYLYPYYKRDIEEGRLTRDSALELLECLWLNMAQCVPLDQMSKIGFKQGYPHFEFTTIGGQTPDGKDATNELSYLILESKKEFPLDYPDLGVRIHSQTPEPFLLKVCELIKEGGGFPKLLNDEEIIPRFLARGAPSLEEARDYSGAGCTEARMRNRDTYYVCSGMVNLGAALEMALNDGVFRLSGKQLGAKTGDSRSFATFDEVMNAFRLQVENLFRHYLIKQRIAETLKPQRKAMPLLSCLHELCMRNCVDFLHGRIEGGFSVGNCHAVGFGTVIDSLAAIKKLVYDDKKVTMGELLQALATNFEGKEALRQMCLNAPKYGNNDPYPDSIGYQVEDIMAAFLAKNRNSYGGTTDLCYVPVTVHGPMGLAVGATPNGRKAAEPLSEGISPTQGCDTKGPTTTLISIRNTKAARHTNIQSRLLNMKLSPQAIAGEEGTKKLAALIRTWCDMKHWHIQFNVVNSDTLRAAQKDPEKYRNLLVRVAGYSAYFVDLSPEMQAEIISRTEHQSA